MRGYNPKENMPNKIPIIISVLLTIALLIVLGFVSIFFQMIALNGAGERWGITALGISVLCQSMGLLLAGTFAGWITNIVIAKFNWHKILAVGIGMLAGILLGTVISFLSAIISIPLAGIR